MTGDDILRIGYVPLIDCAIPVAAAELGFDRQHGIRLRLEREPSWASIRDKLAFGSLDAAHMLAGMPLAATIGIAGPQVPMVAPMALGLGGNAIVVSMPLYQRMLDLAPEAMRGPRGLSAAALARVVEQDRAAGRPPPALACVSPVSSHYYELCCWLATAGIDPRRDVDIGVVAPPRMVESLRSGWIDGYCVGEPWALRAVEQGIGAIVATKADIWPDAPEKVLGLRADWAAANEETVLALVRALIEAARWADEPGNRAELATLLASERYLGTGRELLHRALAGRCCLRPGAPVVEMPHRHVFFERHATFPWRSQALWLLVQMVRWGQAPPMVDIRRTASTVYRPDLYRRAAAELDVALPDVDERAVGPDQVLDGLALDPADPEAYLARLGADAGRTG